jgi:hypothetical protein
VIPTHEDRQEYRDTHWQLTGDERQVNNRVVGRLHLEDGDYSADVLVARREGDAAVFIDIDVLDTDYSSTTVLELTPAEAIDFGRAVLNAVSQPPPVMTSANFAPITP